MSKEKLCEVLGIEVSGEGKYTLKNINTGEELKFKTIQEIANKFNISKSTVEYNMGGEVTINENTFFVITTKLTNQKPKLNTRTVMQSP